MSDEDIKVKAGGLIIPCLEKLGIKYTSGIPGSHILTIYNSLNDSKSIKHILVRHEASASVIADAYGRLSGTPMAVIVTAGPGATNTVTGVAQAYGAASPMLVITGNVPLKSGPSTFHGVDTPYFLESIFRDITKATFTVDKPENIPSVLVNGYNISISGRKGPVHISIPIDVGIAEVELPHELSCQASPEELAYSKLVIKDISKSISGKKIVLLLGAEIATSISNDLIIEIAERLNSPVIVQIEGLGYFPQGHELYAGYIEKRWDIHPSAIRVMKEADIVLALGLRPGEEEYEQVERYSEGEIIYIGYTRGMGGENIKMILVGDVIKYLEDIRSIEGDQSKWYVESIDTGSKEYQNLVDNIGMRGPSGYIHPGYASKIISNYIKDGSLVTVDIGTHETWARLTIGARLNIRYLYPGNYGSMGFGLPAAIGGYLSGYRNIITIIGDGGLLMCMEELSTIAQYNMDIKIFVFNDSSYGMIYHMQKKFFGRAVSSQLHPVDFAKISEGLGVKSLRASRPEELDEVISNAFSIDGPVLVDIYTDYKVKYVTSGQ
jgi:acetolactate synthase-1/2/3 large subunit